MPRYLNGAFARGLDPGPDLAGRHRHDEPKRVAREQGLGPVVGRLGELDQPIPDQGGLGDQHGRRVGVVLMPTEDGVPGPEPDGFLDRRVGEAVDLGIARQDLRCFERASRHIPLQQRDPPLGPMGHPGELLDQQALPDAGQTGQKHDPLTAGQDLEPSPDRPVRRQHDVVRTRRDHFPGALCSAWSAVRRPIAI